jgi:Asp-tRNA(Asn)/Glu-tRNA(Gln) amidotransferase A subunit family amidase
MALAWTLDKIGPLCRSAEDCGLVLETISGSDSSDPLAGGKTFYYAPQFARDFKDLRAGFAAVDFEEWADPAARPDFAKALDTLRSLGLQMKETKLPDFPYGPLISTVIAAEEGAVFEQLIQSGKVDELADQKQIAGLKAAIGVPAKDYLKAMRIRNLLQEAFRELFYDVDVLVTPSRLGPAPKITQSLDAPSDRPTPATPGLTALVPAGNLAGLPALSLPCGFAGGMPIGVQLVGRAFSENMLLAIGKAFQGRTDWHKRRPPVS